MSGKQYSEKEVQFIIHNYHTMTAHEIAKALNRSYASIQAKCKNLQLKQTLDATPEITKRVLDHLTANCDADGFVLTHSLLLVDELSITDREARSALSKLYKHKKISFAGTEGCKYVYQIIPPSN